MPRPERFVADPVDRSRENEDRARAHDRELDRRAMHDPRHWGTLPLCPFCGRVLLARADCGACGDAEDMAA